MFIPGLSALIIRQQIPIMIGASLLFVVLAMDNSINPGEGVLLFSLGHC